MTAPDPLREDEVEAVARAIDPAPWALWDMMPGRIAAMDAALTIQKDHARVAARAAIIRLDELRGK